MEITDSTRSNGVHEDARKMRGAQRWSLEVRRRSSSVRLRGLRCSVLRSVASIAAEQGKYGERFQDEPGQAETQQAEWAPAAGKQW